MVGISKANCILIWDACDEDLCTALFSLGRTLDLVLGVLGGGIGEVDKLFDLSGRLVHPYPIQQPARLYAFSLLYFVLYS